MKTKGFYIDTNLLEDRGACIWGRLVFENAFPEASKGKKVMFTYENWEKARKGKVNLRWLAEKVLGFNEFSLLEFTFRGRYYTPTGGFNKRYGDHLYNAIKEKLEAK